MKLRALSGSARSETAAASGAAMQCLIVDDDVLSRGALARQLGTLGVAVREAGDARQGLFIWRHWRPSAVLIDCVMPGSNGYVLARRIRQIEREKCPPIATVLIGVSGHTSRSHIARCEGVGMDGVLGKPASTQAFAHMLGLSPQPAPASDVDPHASELHYLYVSSCESDLQMIEQGLRQWRAQQIGFHAHRIEGASRVVGAEAVANAARDLYDAFAQGQPMPSLQPLCVRLSAAFSPWRDGAFAPDRGPRR